MFWNNRMIVLLTELVTVAKSILKVLRLRRPGLVYLRIVGEFQKGSDWMLRFKLLLPAPGASDVVTRKLTVAIGAAEPVTVDLPGDALESAEYSGGDNETVSGSLVDVDDAGNQSEAREFSFVLVDTLPPPQPGEIGLVVTGEE
jgi:hypothetical protein